MLQKLRKPHLQDYIHYLKHIIYSPRGIKKFDWKPKLIIIIIRLSSNTVQSPSPALTNPICPTKCMYQHHCSMTESWLHVWELLFIQQHMAIQDSSNKLIAPHKTSHFFSFLSVSIRHMRRTHSGPEILFFLLSSESSLRLWDLEFLEESVLLLWKNKTTNHKSVVSKT